MSINYSLWKGGEEKINAKCSHPLYWYGLYKQSYDLWCFDSYSHPAKMSVALTFKIMEHLKKLGLLAEGEPILDPMCGISTTGIVAGALGHPYIGVELEEKFINFSQQNKEYAERKLYKKFDWQIIEGDSRKLSELLHDNGLKSVMSPPYGSSKIVSGKQTVWSERLDPHGRDIYGITGGQIGNLPDRPLKAVTSPPYLDGYSIREGGQVNKEYVEKRKEKLREQGRDELADSLKVQEYGSRNPDNIGNLKDVPLKAVMSPPYDNARNTSQEYDDKYDLRRPPGIKWGRESFRGRYDDTEGQIGKEQSETYLEAMSKVYSEIGRVSDVLCVVIKNPTRNGKLRRLDLDTIKILEMSGWKIHCQHRALLFEELEQATLFGETEKKVKGRLSFFKRLAYIKGSPVANWEDIIFAVR